MIMNKLRITQISKLIIMTNTKYKINHKRNKYLNLLGILLLNP